MNSKTLSHNACYAHSDIPVPMGFNMPKNRIDIEIYAYSDTTIVDVSLYEYHGLYWFSFSVRGSRSINSIGFVGLQNCVANLRATVRGLGLTLDNSDCLSRFVRAWNRGGRKVV